MRRGTSQDVHVSGAGKETGFVSLLTLLLTSLGIVIVTAMSISAVSQYRTALASMQICKGNWLAEAAVVQAIGELNRDPAWTTGFSNLPFGEGTFSLSVQPLDTRQVKLMAEGRCGGIRRTLEVIYDTKSKKVMSWKEG
jgi:hypothetical protein